MVDNNARMIENIENNVYNIVVNNPPFPPRTPEITRNLYHSNAAAVVFAGERTNSDDLVEAIDRTAHTLGVTQPGDPRLLIVAPDGLVDSHTAGLFVPSTEINKIIDADRLQSEFGAQWNNGEVRSGTALMNALLLQRLIADKMESNQDYLMQVDAARAYPKRGTPLEWMGWLAATYNPAMVQRREWNAANEGLRAASVPLPIYGNVGQEVFDAFKQGWMPASLTLSVPELQYGALNANSIHADQLTLTLSAVEYARQRNQGLLQLKDAYPDPSVTPDFQDAELIVKLTTFDVLRQVLFNKNRRLSEATPEDFRTMNTMMAQAESIFNTSAFAQHFGSLIPSIDTLIERRLVDVVRALRLVRSTKPKQWVFERTPEKSALTPVPLEEQVIDSGLVPNHNPYDLKPLITEIIRRLDDINNGRISTVGGQLYDLQAAKKGERPIISLENDPILKQYNDLLASLMVYNQPIGEDHLFHPFDIMADDMQPVREKVEAMMKSGSIQVRVINPFAGEEATVGGVLDYTTDCVGRTVRPDGKFEEVLAVDAGRSEASTQIAKDSNAHYISEKEHLGALDLDRLREDIGWSGEMKGSKALTMLAGMIECERQYQEGKITDDTYIIFHDTDFDTDPKNPEQYAALHYLFLPLTFPGGNELPRAIHMAKSGPGRNNIPMHLMASDYMGSQDPNIRELGHAMAGLIWMLTGERAIKYGDLRKMKWTNGMGIETILDIQTAGMDQEEGVRRLVQVANRRKKPEVDKSKPSREHGMIFALARFMQYMKAEENWAAQNHGEQYALSPLHWDIHDIAEFNKRLGGKPIPQTFYDTETDETRPNYIQTAITDFVLPSMEQLVKGGYVDFSRLAA